MAHVCRLGWAVLALLSAPVYAGHLDQVRASKVLRVCVFSDQPAISYRHPDNGRLTGVGADLARELARDLGARLKFVDASWPKVADQVLQNQCDLAMSVLGVPGPRTDKLRFTRPHLGGALCAVVARDNVRIKEWSDLDRKGVQLAVSKGSVADAMVREAMKVAAIQVLDSGVDRVRELEGHRVDALLTDCQEALSLQETSTWARHVAPPAGSGLRSLSHAWAMVQEDDRWYARVEYFMSEIRRDGRLRTAARRYGLEHLALLD